MWNNEDNPDDRRFLKDLGPILNLARKGDLAHTFNLFGYFCKKVGTDKIPDNRVIDFVSDSLIRSQSPQRQRRWERNRSIPEYLAKEQMKGLPLRSSRRLYSAASNVSKRLISKGLPISDSRVVAIKYEKTHPILVLRNILKAKSKPTLVDLKAVLPIANTIYRSLLKYDTGKRLRSRLELNNKRLSSLKSILDQEMINSINHLISSGHKKMQVYKIVAKHYGYSVWRVEKTYHRHQNKF